MELRFILLLSVLGGCVAAPVEDRATDPVYLSGNLIGNSTLEAGSEGPEGWFFLSDDGVDAVGHRAAEDGTALLHTEILKGSAPGHARWWFEPVALQGGKFYEYADTYRSYGTARLVFSHETVSERRFHSAWQSSTSSEWARTRFRFYVSEDSHSTVMHLLDRPGYLETSSHSLREVAPAPFDRPMVSITFDDGDESNLTIAAPELERRGWRGSFYVILDSLNEEGHLGSEQVRTLANRGHEIGSHSASHRPLVEVSTEELRDEVEGSLLQLAKLGAGRGFAYPAGEFDELVEHYVGSKARYIRTSLHGLNDATFDRRRIRVYAVTTETTWEDLERAIDDVIRTRTWLVFLFHDLGAPGAGSPYRTDSTQFVQLLTALEQAEVEVLPVQQVLEQLGK